jgi:ATP-dependent RNA helicase DeaD
MVETAEPQTSENAESKFASLGLRPSVVRGLEAHGFDKPTDIQAQIIPLILENKDVLGQARTGTGKTAAFALPLISKADRKKAIQTLVLVPTRELAVQVVTEINALGKFTPIKALAIYGGDPIRRQITALKKRPNIVVGTPGRVMDLHGRGPLPYDGIETVVLDEVDRMLDIGFREDIQKIMNDMKGNPQTIFVSATISSDIDSLARRFMKDPARIDSSGKSLTVAEVDQSFLPVEHWDKAKLLIHLLTHEDPPLTLVFCRTKITVDRLARRLKDDGIEVNAIHGDMPQRKRNAIMKRLRAGALAVVVASDLAARGLDVTGISHVVNYDLPEDPEVYIHRIGRTARAGRRGTAWSFVEPNEGHRLTEIEKLANIEIPKKEFPDFTPSEVPTKVRQAREKAEQDLEKRKQSVSRTAGPAPVWQQKKKEVDPTKFPGGVVPSGPPKRTLGGRVRTRRGG